MGIIPHLWRNYIADIMGYPTHQMAYMGGMEPGGNEIRVYDRDFFRGMARAFGVRRKYRKKYSYTVPVSRVMGPESDGQRISVRLTHIDARG